MAPVDVFEGKHGTESARYFCRVVTDGWQPNGDVQQVMSALYTMAWAVDQLPKDSKIRQRLQIQCAAITCFLLDRKTEVVINKKN